MKMKFLKRCAATVMAVSVLSMGLVSNAAQSSAVMPKDSPDNVAQKVYGDSEPVFPFPNGEQISCDQYLSALLDFYYRNDPQAVIALGFCTAEEAAAYYSEAFDMDFLSSELDSFLGVECPEALENELRTLMLRLTGGAHYAVTGCELQPDGTYEVTVICEQMIIFNPMMELYTAVVTDLVQTWAADSASAPSEEDMMIQLLAALCSSLNVCLDNVTYAEPALTTVSFEPQDGVYIPDTGDIDDLENLLFDTYTILE